MSSQKCFVLPGVQRIGDQYVKVIPEPILLLSYSVIKFEQLSRDIQVVRQALLLAVGF